MQDSEWKNTNGEAHDQPWVFLVLVSAESYSVGPLIPFVFESRVELQVCVKAICSFMTHLAV